MRVAQEEAERQAGSGIEVIEETEWGGEREGEQDVEEQHERHGWKRRGLAVALDFQQRP